MTPPFTTADLYDAHKARCASCATPFRQYGGRRAFSGRIRTVQCRGDNALIRQTLGTPSEGEVLVVDGGGVLDAALLGDRLAGLGLENHWAGIVILGAVRDVVALGGLDFGVKALGSNPRTSAKTGAGQRDVPVSFGGIVFAPGNWLYSDEDGILVSEERLA